MEAIGYLHVASAYEVSENIEVVAIKFEFKFLQWPKLSSVAAMRLLSVALTIGLLNIADQTLALQQVGDRGAEVTNIQKCLKNLGYFNGPVTGRFATLTQRAVSSFQKAKGLAIDGIVGANTRNMLQQSCQGVTTGETTNGQLRVGSKGQAVSQLQQKLRQLGYFNGSNTGYFGSQTRQAVIRLQKASEIPVTGIVDTRTAQALQGNFAGVGGEYPILSEGSNGAAVTKLQKRLRDLGYFKMNPTGNFRSITKDSLATFQRRVGLPGTGVANQQTWEALLNSAPVASGSKVVLSSGAKGENVRLVQERLSELGYFNRVMDGYFRESTKVAVKEFQRDYRLNPTGKVDRQTWQALGFDGSVTTNRPVSNRYYVAAVPMQNSNTLDKVRRFVPNAFPDVSMSGNYVNAGAFSDRSVAENLTKMLRSNGLNARVQYL